MGTYLKVGQIGKKLKMGSVIISPSRESDIVSPLFTKASTNNHEKVCVTGVLGLKEINNKRDDYVYGVLIKNSKGMKKVGMKRN